MKLNVKGFALTAGILVGLSVLLITLISLWHGGGGHLALLKLIFPGYEVTYLGSIVGLAHGFAYGLIAGALFGWLYNWLAG